MIIIDRSCFYVFCIRIEDIGVVCIYPNVCVHESKEVEVISTKELFICVNLYLELYIHWSVGSLLRSLRVGGQQTQQYVVT